MKNFIMLLLILFISCKTRQVSTVKTNFVTSIDSTALVKTTVKKSDSTNKVADVRQMSSDTSSDELEITPDSGEVQVLHVDRSGNISYTGKAKDIKVIGSIINHSEIKKEMLDKEAKSTDSTTVKSSNTTKYAQQSIKAKTTVSKPSFAGIITGLVIVLILAAAVFLFFKFKKFVI